MAQYLTLADENQFQFVCPIFNVETKMRLCNTLRDLVYAGRPPAVRKGCQACMRAGKCPAAQIITRISFGAGKVGDDYGATEPTVGKLRQDVLERIAPVIVLESVLNSMQVPDAERELIATANDRIQAQLKSAPKPSGEFVSRAVKSEFGSSARKRSTPKPKAPANTNTAINAAAASGDLAAAIS